MRSAPGPILGGVAAPLSTPAAAVPSRPEDGTVPVIVLFTTVSSCLTDCNC